MKRSVAASLFPLILLLPGRLPAQEAKEILPREALVLPSVGRYGRGTVALDPVEAQIVAGTWAVPKAGDTVTLSDGNTRAWQAAKVGADGALGGGGAGGRYAYFPIPSDAARVMVLEVNGHMFAYFNGEPHAGDPYGHGYVHVPVALRKGTNDLLLLGSQRADGVRVRLVAPKAAAQFELADVTQPDLRVGEATDTRAALPVLNATAVTLDGLTIEATVVGGSPITTALPALAPLSTRKTGFAIKGPAPEKDGECLVQLRLLKKGEGRPLDTATLKLGVGQPEQSYKRTFVSRIDGSVQYYAVQPAHPAEGAKDAPALVLTLHGAAVEAIGQANAYGGKSWAHVVAPTNRRPFGFDWEDWGRLDALEVLEIAKESLKTDARRTYLTGHSMGGHGTWHVGLTFPDRFAAIAPSAGWVSFSTYAGGARPGATSPVQELIQRAANPSDTQALARNALHYGVYVLHGEADDNVPVGQARTMRGVLGGFHPDFAYYERPGAGHWWGNECVDWPPLFDFLGRHTLTRRRDVRKVEFVTASPGVSARCDWADIEAQQHALKFSRVDLTCDPQKRRFSGKTENVARLALDLAPLKPGEPLSVDLDGQKIEKIDWPDKERLWLARDKDTWSVTKEPSPSLKGPRRYGPFKDAFRNRMVFVYGTQGTPEENAWALARARFDAETFWYRGNGSVDVVPDTDAAALVDRDRNVILYGNADTNAAWKTLLGDSPVQVRRGRLTVGDREEKGDGLACLFLRPRPDSDRACVAAVAGSGLPGMRLTERRAYFQSGAGYPDCLVLDAGALGRGGDGVLAAGYFGNDWGLASGEFAWKK
jgi:pimeloyl-ACP methyl ester carboxylesterase